MIRNPKMEGTSLWDCRPQIGKCSNGCSNCFYNRPGAFYCDINKPYLPDPNEVGDSIVRMNSGHDSNIQRELVIETAKKYKNYFFNTSIPNFDFPGPVVFTANPREEEFVYIPEYDFYIAYLGIKCIKKENFDNLMFIRLRVSPTNLDKIELAIQHWTKYQIPIVLTYMAYYDCAPPGCVKENYLDNPPAYCYTWRDSEDNRAIQEENKHIIAYTWQKRHINSYYCPTTEYKEYVLKKMKAIGGRLVTMCGTVTSNYCKDCLNCQNYYWLTKKHVEEM